MLKPIRPVSLRDEAHTRVRGAILGGRYRGGERLRERELAAELGVSTTPLKEAVRRLEAEGLLRTEARRGVFVTYGRAQAEEMSLARAAIESTIARVAARRASPEAVAGMKAHLDVMTEATEAGDAERLLRLNAEFHTLVHAASGCDYLCRLQAQQRFFDHAARGVLLRCADERGRALAEHGAILAAIAARDESGAEALMRDHVIRSGRHHLDTLFRSDDQKGTP